MSLSGDKCIILTEYDWHAGHVKRQMLTNFGENMHVLYFCD